ncbi:MAG: hypothetical protein NTX25_05175 [Proteobacteria bacterium]|nr:hypothetical protein [Pseudomonadota bacterium]
MDTVDSYQCKTSYLKQQNLGSLLFEIQTRIHAMLIQENDLRLFSPAMIRSLTFDLSYVLLRHRAWHNAPILAELTIDFLNSEFLVPRALCGQLVENSLDLLHNYTPVEADWTSEQYESEFLEHLLICGAIAEGDSQLADDIGFGRNLSELLRAAMRLDQDSGEGSLFQFAAELVNKLHEILTRILSQQKDCPWILDIYHLKNILQRDPHTRKNDLDLDSLKRLFSILIECSWKGASLKDLSKKSNAAELSADLEILLKHGLIYLEPKGRQRSPFYCLSAVGFQLTEAAFSFNSSRTEIKSLLQLPAAYQTAYFNRHLDSLPEEHIESIQSLAGSLAPESLRIFIEYLLEKQKIATLVELFKNLLHSRAHAWIRVEICQALPLMNQMEIAKDLLQSLASEDLSPMVRKAARLALQQNSCQNAAL